MKKAPSDDPRCKCLRCGWSWRPKRKDARPLSEPVECPSCKSRYWNVKKEAA